MNKKTISVIVTIAILAIIAVFVMDYLSKRPDKLGANPYKLDVAEYEEVEASLIHFKETKNFLVENENPGGIDVSNELIFLCGENFLQLIAHNGIQKLFVELEGSGTCVKAIDEIIYVGFHDHIETYSIRGEMLAKWDVPGENCVFTSLAIMDDVIYVADAGNRRVLRYDLSGKLLGEFEGKAESAAGHGFIVPSPNFDLITNAYGELWVVNPGKHALENYTNEGVMRGFWEANTMDVDGFAGCCNPAEIAVFEDGSFVTSEKGLVRIKVHDQSGKLVSVVAAPDKFEKEGKAPEVAVDGKGNVYALDFDRKMVRVFEPKQEGKRRKE
jgi:hypothetical protein